MIDALKRTLGIVQNSAQAENKEEKTTMSTPAKAEDTVVTDLQASVAELSTQLASALSKVAELTEVIETAKEMQATKEAAALEAKLADRKLKVVEAVGTASADTVMTALAGLDDGAFATVLSAMAVTSKKESETQLFAEQGVDDTADATKLAAAAASNPVMDYLQSKYAQK